MYAGEVSLRTGKLCLKSHRIDYYKSKSFQPLVNNC